MGAQTVWSFLDFLYPSHILHLLQPKVKNVRNLKSIKYNPLHSPNFTISPTASVLLQRTLLTRPKSPPTRELNHSL